MVTFREALRELLRRDFCRLAGGGGDYYRIFGRLFPPGQEPDLNWFGSAYRWLCNREPPPFTPPDGPGSRGQCPGVAYNVTYQRTLTPWSSDPPVIDTDIAQVTGPILGWDTIAVDSGQGYNAVSFWIVTESTLFGPYLTANVSTIASPLFWRSAEFAVLDIERVDGLPDDCGTAPIVPPNTPPPPRPDIVVYNDDDGVEINVPITINWGFAYIDADLVITVPVNVTFNNDFGFNLTLRFDGPEFNFNFPVDADFNFYPPGAEPPPGGPPPTLPPGSDPPPPPPGAPTDPPPPPARPEERRVIIGVLVTTTEINAGTSLTQIFQEEANPDVWAPNLGYVNFLIRVSADKYGWTVDQPVKNRRHLIPCPWPQGAVSVAGTPRPGVSWDLQPIYATLSASESVPSYF